MTVTVTKFWRTKELILGGGVSLMNNDLYIMLVKPGFEFSNGLAIYNQISGLEIDQSTNYQTGGLLIEGDSITTNALTGKAEYRIPQVAFDALSAQIRYAILYADVTAYGLQKPLIALCDFGQTLTFNSTIFQFQWPEPIMRW